MVYCGETEETGERVRDVVMAMGPERSKPPLHNFDLPILKWGNQRYLRCMKPPADSNTNNNSKSNSRMPIAIPTADRRRSSRSPPSKFFASRNLDSRRFKQPRLRFDVGDGEEGIEAVGEKMILDLKTEADRMKDEILGKTVSDDDDEDEREDEEHEEEEQEQEQSPRPAPAEQEVRPWNLRTRRAACKAPMTVGNSVTGKGLRIEERKASNNSPLRSDSAKSPRLRAEKREKEDKEKEKERVKFAVGLSRKEIEEDFMQMVGHRPARRPKKRPRTVQKQLDSLFPGLWLTEVTVDMYKVPELPDNGKR